MVFRNNSFTWNFMPLWLPSTFSLFQSFSFPSWVHLTLFLSTVDSKCYSTWFWTWYVMFEKYGMGLRFPHTGKYFFIVWHLTNSRGGIVTTGVKLLLIQHKTMFLHHQSLPKTVIFCYISFNNQALIYQG